MPPKPKFSDAQLVKYHRRGMSDPQIARLLGVQKSAVQKRRNALELPPNIKSGGGRGESVKNDPSIQWALEKRKMREVLETWLPG